MLIMTLGVLAILSVVTLALMERLDRLRFELGATQSYAHAQWQEREAKEAALYYMATRSMTSRNLLTA